MAESKQQVSGATKENPYDRSSYPKIVPRAKWNARSPVSVSNLPSQPVKYVFIHHSDEGECHDLPSGMAVVRGFQNHHMDKNGWDDIGYSFVIGGDGTVMEGRGWDRVGAHTKSYNDVGLGFCLVGNFMRHLPSKKQLDAVKSLIKYGVSLGKISPSYVLRGHRDMGSTECPGDKLYAEIRTWPHYT